MSTPESSHRLNRPRRRKRSHLLAAILLLALVPAASLVISTYAYIEDRSDRVQ